MAKLSAFTRNATTMADGTPVEVGSRIDPFTVVARGMTDAYSDRLWELRQLASIEYNAKLKRGDIRSTPNNLPPSLDDRCVAQALGEKCVIDVSGLDNDDGTPVTVDQFRDMLLHRENVILLRLTLDAVASVGIEDKDQVEDAEKN